LEIIINRDASSRVALDPRRQGELVARFDTDGIYDKVSLVDGTILQLEAGKDLVVGAIICRSRELVCGRTVGEDLNAHGLDLAEDHLSCVSIELAREGVGLPVDNADVIDTVQKQSVLLLDEIKRVKTLTFPDHTRLSQLPAPTTRHPQQQRVLLRLDPHIR